MKRYDHEALSADVLHLRETLNRLNHRVEQAERLRLHLAIWPGSEGAAARLKVLEEEVGQLQPFAQDLIDSIGERLAGLRAALAPLMLEGDHPRA